MKKGMKILALALAVIMVFGVASTAFASNYEEDLNLKPQIKSINITETIETDESKPRTNLTERSSISRDIGTWSDVEMTAKKTWTASNQRDKQSTSRNWCVNVNHNLLAESKGYINTSMSIPRPFPSGKSLRMHLLGVQSGNKVTPYYTITDDEYRQDLGWSITNRTGSYKLVMYNTQNERYYTKGSYSPDTKNP